MSAQVSEAPPSPPAAQVASPPHGLSLASGMGLVAANMVGAGVFLSMGFMVKFGGMGPGAVLAAWGLGAALALLGTQAYGALAADSGRSGGEYTLLSRYLHPSLGWLAGWGSLLLGFSAPIAVDALAVGAYAQALAPGLDARSVATGTVLALALVHARDSRTSRWAQDALIVVKVLLLLGFVAAGLGLGSTAWPSWGAERPWSLDAIWSQQYWVAFAFSGWNAAIYVAGEFREPRKTVPRAMLLGCALVGVLYLAVNFVFVANLTPEMIGDPTALSRGGTMLGHLVAGKLLGPVGATVMSAVTLLVFLSATSAMIFAGPRVAAAMAEDGALPSIFRASAGHPPRAAAALQVGIALLLVWTQTLQKAVDNAATILLLFTSLVAVCAVRLSSAAPWRRVCAALYAAFAAYLLWKGAQEMANVRLVLGVTLGAWVARLSFPSLLSPGSPR